jgi:vacuolar-type H+-ATPase subunit H
MEALEKIKAAEEEAMELKRKAKLFAEKNLTQTETNARREADAMIAQAKKAAADTVENARRKAEDTAHSIREKGAAENAALEKTASRYEANALKLVLGKL